MNLHSKEGDKNDTNPIICKLQVAQGNNELLSIYLPR